MKRKFVIAHNVYFTLPFLAWVVAGGWYIHKLGRQALFQLINNNYSPFGDDAMRVVTHLGEAAVIVPLLFTLFAFGRLRNVQYLVSGLVCNILPFILQQLMKSLLSQPRPMAFYDNPDWSIRFLPEWDRFTARSNPSGHSVGAFSLFCFLSLLLPAKYRAYGFIFFLLAFLVGYSRVYLAAHFFEDVYFGGIFGFITTTLLYSLLMKFNLTPHQSISTSGNS